MFIVFQNEVHIVTYHLRVTNIMVSSIAERMTSGAYHGAQWGGPPPERWIEPPMAAGRPGSVRARGEYAPYSSPTLRVGQQQPGRG
jgi:hypothetical protein